MTCYRKHLRRVIIILQKKRNKKEWTKSWFVRSKSSFATICKQLTVKLYTKDISSISCTQRILKITSGCQSNFTLQILLSTKHDMLVEW